MFAGEFGPKWDKCVAIVTFVTLTCKTPYRKRFGIRAISTKFVPAILTGNRLHHGWLSKI